MLKVNFFPNLDEITGKNLKSALRTVVRRSAFQQGADQSLRFSLDMNLHIINEDVDTRRGADSWARNLENPIKLKEVVTLPYAVLEVKTQKQAPDWVDDLKCSGYIIASDHFSKFLYGTCKLLPGNVRVFPRWWERVIGLESVAPISPPLIACSLMSKTPQSAKFRSSIVALMEERETRNSLRVSMKASLGISKHVEGAGEGKEDIRQVKPSKQLNSYLERSLIKTSPSINGESTDKKDLKLKKNEKRERKEREAQEAREERERKNKPGAVLNHNLNDRKPEGSQEAIVQIEKLDLVCACRVLCVGVPLRA